ncbi:hypothetical protein I2483_13400 [Sporosarcina sp. E16_3]|uniref:hypothetical protein n=1 Tax=Sporosarcina sp. E16_3 TaxID=2789293 RepID=UPI001A931D92|nr:hypothetical protein [Sporosarcina sp. E16_3]MBO0602657.1 hypothetical protein [Sporosarcina sp. E16_3]
MKNVTIAISLRVLVTITFSLYAFSIFNYDSPTSLSSSSSSSRLYIMLSFWIVLGLIHFQQYKYIKNSPDGRFIMKEMILPEFNSNDEREAVITGKAAKNALLAILILTPIALATMALILTFEGKYPILLTLLIASSIPIAGLITYYFSYRHHYLQ